MKMSTKPIQYDIDDCYITPIQESIQNKISRSVNIKKTGEVDQKHIHDFSAPNLNHDTNFSELTRLIIFQKQHKNY